MLRFRHVLRSATEHVNITNVNQYIHKYPPSKPNTVLNICPQGKIMVVETLGKFSKAHPPGLFFAFPLLQKVSYVIDTKELVVDVNKQQAYTLDNVQVSIAAQLYLQFTNVYKACYNVKHPLVAIISHAQAAMRSSVGKNDLDHLLKDRNGINNDVSQALYQSSEEWGVKINRVAITTLQPDKQVAEAMDLQATAERQRRQTEKNAEASKRAMELESEGQKLKAINQAVGRAEALRLETEAQVNAIKSMEVVGLNGSDVLKYQTTLKYIEGLVQLANNGKHSTFFLGKDLSDSNVMTKNVLETLAEHKKH